MLTFATLCYLQHEDRVLLQRKARGLFGEGKWNAPGGKMLPRESPSEGAAREVQEETGVKVSTLRFHGILNFYLGDSKELDQTVFVFSCEKFEGTIEPSKEGKLRWFPIKQVPYHEMWADDQTWLPLVLEGKSFVGDFYFTDNYKELVSHSIKQTSRK